MRGHEIPARAASTGLGRCPRSTSIHWTFEKPVSGKAVLVRRSGGGGSVAPYGRIRRAARSGRWCGRACGPWRGLERFQMRHPHPVCFPAGSLLRAGDDGGLSPVCSAGRRGSGNFRFLPRLRLSISTTLPPVVGGPAPIVAPHPRSAALAAGPDAGHPRFGRIMPVRRHRRPRDQRHRAPEPDPVAHRRRPPGDHLRAIGREPRTRRRRPAPTPLPVGGDAERPGWARVTRGTVIKGSVDGDLAPRRPRAGPNGVVSGPLHRHRPRPNPTMGDGRPHAWMDDIATAGPTSTWLAGRTVLLRART